MLAHVRAGASSHGELAKTAFFVFAKVRDDLGPYALLRAPAHPGRRLRPVSRRRQFARRQCGFPNRAGSTFSTTGSRSNPGGIRRSATQGEPGNVRQGREREEGRTEGNGERKVERG